MNFSDLFLILLVANKMNQLQKHVYLQYLFLLIIHYVIGSYNDECQEFKQFTF